VNGDLFVTLSNGANSSIDKLNLPSPITALSVSLHSDCSVLMDVAGNLLIGSYDRYIPVPRYAFVTDGAIQYERIQPSLSLIETLGKFFSDNININGAQENISISVPLIGVFCSICSGQTRQHLLVVRDNGSIYTYGSKDRKGLTYIFKPSGILASNNFYEMKLPL